VLSLCSLFATHPAFSVHVAVYGLSERIMMYDVFRKVSTFYSLFLFIALNIRIKLTVYSPLFKQVTISLIHCPWSACSFRKILLNFTFWTEINYFDRKPAYTDHNSFIFLMFRRWRRPKGWLHTKNKKIKKTQAWKNALFHFQTNLFLSPTSMPRANPQAKLKMLRPFFLRKNDSKTDCHTCSTRSSRVCSDNVLVVATGREGTCKSFRNSITTFHSFDSDDCLEVNKIPPKICFRAEFFASSPHIKRSSSSSTSNSSGENYDASSIYECTSDVHRNEMLGSNIYIDDGGKILFEIWKWGPHKLWTFLGNERVNCLIYLTSISGSSVSLEEINRNCSYQCILSRQH